MAALPRSVSDTLALLGKGQYVSDRSLATAIYLSLTLNRPHRTRVSRLVITLGQISQLASSGMPIGHGLGA